MNKSQAINTFWSGFGIPAFDENSVPENTPFPYITYAENTGSLGDVLLLSASIWDKSTSWVRISEISERIAKAIGEHGHYTLPLDGGYVWITKGSPFAQRMGDPEDERIKRVYLNIQAEFLTAY